MDEWYIKFCKWVGVLWILVVFFKWGTGGGRVRSTRLEICGGGGDWIWLISGGKLWSEWIREKGIGEEVEDDDFILTGIIECTGDEVEEDGWVGVDDVVGEISGMKKGFKWVEG